MSKVKKALKQRSTWAGLGTLALTFGQLFGDITSGGAVSAAVTAVAMVGGMLGLVDDDVAKGVANDRSPTVSH
ncbi:hypothetical protein BCU71_07650 [Vibrio lentus]|uniref:hypothetical protein n=1 Tax=Vibrio lentus TaxID=136468 RepID=UPI000C86066F|nr:hypothetical protein [Vibrio lentus]PMH28429.1 hypothetical protein BCU71_07650 [Vibrio lentus]PMK70410.1 hypothetical protein BCT93_07285 [Vibrio lentus]